MYNLDWKHITESTNLYSHIERDSKGIICTHEKYENIVITRHSYLTWIVSEMDGSQESVLL